MSAGVAGSQVPLPGLPRSLPELNSIRSFAANAIEEAQGAFSREVQERPLPRDFVPTSAH